MRWHGWLCIDKPPTLSSAQAVWRVKHLLRLPRQHKIGHAGTLDPLASGVLPLALGEATKTVPFVMASEKAYRFTVRWGVQTATDDAEGDVTARSDVRPTRAQIEAILPNFTGTIQQVPPAYSAIKVEGRRAYALARAGETVVLQAREVEIMALRLCASVAGNYEESDFEVECSKGTYIRSLARDMAQALGTQGHICALRRTGCGKFKESGAISLDLLEELVHKDALQEVAERYLLPIESVLDDIPAVTVDADAATKLRQGQAVRVDSSGKTGEMLARCDAKAVAIVMVEHGLARPARVFNC